MTKKPYTKECYDEVNDEDYRPLPTEDDADMLKFFTAASLCSGKAPIDAVTDGLAAMQLVQCYLADDV